MKRVVVAMSGGVDSSVAAHLLLEQGYKVIGLFMRMGVLTRDASDQRTCCSLKDANDARRVADALGIPFYVLNFAEQFECIISYFCTEYSNARTPNPCIICNRDLKFGKLLRRGRELEADNIATGHYARVEYGRPPLLNQTDKGNRFLLKKGVDPSKDQSYVLFCLNQEQLSQALFPLGNYRKEEVREIAKKLNLKVKDKPESQEICFIPEGDHKRFFHERFPHAIKPGIVKDLDGNVVGRHPGIQFFTIGQRHGLGIAFGKPKYIVDINAATNTITVGDNNDLLKKLMIVKDVNWTAINSIAQPIEANVKIRYNHTPAPAIIYPSPSDKSSVQVEFREPQRAITPGQAAVFYIADTVIGGGWIG